MVGGHRLDAPWDSAVRACLDACISMMCQPHSPALLQSWQPTSSLPSLHSQGRRGRIVPQGIKLAFASVDRVLVEGPQGSGQQRNIRWDSCIADKAGV